MVNKLSLLKLSKFSVSGRVYGVKTRNTVYPLYYYHIVISIEQSGSFFVPRRLTDADGTYSFSLSLDELSRVASIKAFDPSKKYGQGSENLPSQVLGNVSRDICLIQIDP